MKKLATELMKTPIKLIIVIVGLILICAGLCTINLSNSLKFQPIIQLKSNLDFIGIFIKKYPWFIFVAIMILLVLYWVCNIKIKVSSIKLGNIEIQLKNSDKEIKANVTNKLSSKRTLFCTYRDYDNYYDVINSLYEILIFLRGQLENYEYFSFARTECYKNIEDLIGIIGEFLTKYQSDYRRYYKKRLKVANNGTLFISFSEIQNEYPKIEEMTNDLHSMNNKAKKYADFFSIKIDKWNNWYQSNTQ